MDNYLKFGIAAVVGYIITSFFFPNRGWASKNSTKNSIHSHPCNGPFDTSDCTAPSFNETIHGLIPRDLWPWGPLTEQRPPSIKPTAQR